MGRRGPKPKPRSQVRQPGRIREPEVLPASTMDGRSARRLPRTYETENPDGTMRTVAYLTATRQWWKVHTTGTMATRFVGTDWVRLELLARLVDRYFRRPSHTTLAEIRMNEGLIGGTIGDRERLGVKIMLPSSPSPVSPAKLSDVSKVAAMANYRRAASDNDERVTT